MSKAKFEAAKELIDAKQYDAARSVLKTIDHPMADEWLVKLSRIAPEVATPAQRSAIRETTSKPAPKRRTRSCLVMALVVLLVVIAGAGAAALKIGADTKQFVSDFTTQQVVSDTATALLATSDPNGRWSLSQSTSAIDDSQNLNIQLDAEHKVYGRVLDSLPTLIIRCKKNVLEMYINVGMQVDESDDRSYTRLRLNKDNPEDLTMDASTSGDAVFFPNPSSWVSRFMKADTLAFEFTPFNSGAQTAIFDLRGLTEAIKPIQAGCKI